MNLGKLLAAMALILFFALAQIAPFALAADCSEECLDSSDCTNSTCPVCIGVCSSCYELGDNAACSDTNTGASANCYWMSGSQCVDIAAVPEIPREAKPWLLIGLAVAAGLLARRQRSKKSTQKK